MHELLLLWSTGSGAAAVYILMRAVNKTSLRQSKLPVSYGCGPGQPLIHYNCTHVPDLDIDVIDFA